MLRSGPVDGVLTAAEPTPPGWLGNRSSDGSTWPSIPACTQISASRRTLLTGYVGWARVTDRELVWPVSSLLDRKDVVGTDPDFRDLDVEGADGRPFSGSIVLENPGGTVHDVSVTIDLFDGEQEVGELWGELTLKPRSSGTATLSSLDPSARWTDAYVDLVRSAR